MYNSRLKCALAAGLVLTALACHPNPLPGKSKLVSAEAKSTVTAAELKQNYGQLAAYIKNGYTAYRITYQTVDVNGIEREASGAIFVPDVKTPVPLFNYNHGTIFPSQEKQAPSYLGYSYELIMGKLFSGAGYLVVMPDYLGYGTTKDIDHPYGAYHEIARSVKDMLEAIGDFCKQRDILLSGKHFFSGWSEGAAVALATVKSLEEEGNKQFIPTASVVNAGPYYSSAFVHHILDADNQMKHMNTYVWILQSYNSVYRINRPLRYYFKEPAATALENGPEVNIARDPQALFTPDFINNYKEGKDTALQQALLRNDLWNWKPVSTVVLCHGDKDDYVPIFNSQQAYKTMKAKGADVTLHVFKGKDHSSGVLEFVRAAFDTFESKR